MSAIRSRNGASFALLSMIGTRTFQYGVSTPLYLEYESKLLQTVDIGGTSLDVKQVRAILGALAFFAEPVPIYFRLRPNLRDEGDNFVFECAAHFGAKWIVTHNVKDFRKVRIIGYDVTPITPGEFLKVVKEKLV